MRRNYNAKKDWRYMNEIKILKSSNTFCPKQKKPSNIAELFAVRTGLEPATPCVTGRYSNQLNYRTNGIFRFDLLGQPYVVAHHTGQSQRIAPSCWRSGRDSNPRPPA